MKFFDQAQKWFIAERRRRKQPRVSFKSPQVVTIFLVFSIINGVVLVMFPMCSQEGILPIISLFIHVLLIFNLNNVNLSLRHALFLIATFFGIILHLIRWKSIFSVMENALLSTWSFFGLLLVTFTVMEWPLDCYKLNLKDGEYPSLKNELANTLVTINKSIWLTFALIFAIIVFYFASQTNRM